MPQWYDITRSEDYQALSPEEKSQAKTFFFQKNILPNLQGDVELNDDKVIQFAFDEFMAIPDDTGQGYVTSMLGAAGRGFAGVVPGAVTGAGALLGSETIQGAGESLQEGLESLSPVNPLYEDDIAMKGANVLGNVGGIITTGGIGGALGKGLAAERIAAAGTQAARQALTAQAIQRGASSALYGTGFAQGAAQKAQENERLGMEGPEAYLNLIGGGLSEVLPERFGFGTALETSAARRLLGGVDDAAGKVIPGIRMGAAQEALEGGSTQALSNLSTQLTAPQGVETPGLFEGVGEAALWEGVGGAMFGAINKLGRTPPDKQTPEQQQWQSEINATPVDSTPPVTPEESQKNANEGGIPVVTPDGVVSWLPAVSQAINIQGPQPEGMPSDVEQRLSGLMGKPTDPGIVAAENLVAATVEVPNADITAATAADIIAQNEAFVDSMPPPPSKPAVQPVEEVEEAGAEAIPSLETEMLEKPSQTIITGSNGEIAPEMPVRPLAGEAPPSLPETGPPVVDQEAPAVTTVQAAPIQPTQENAPLAITDTESLRQEPQDRVESREAEGAGVSDQLRSPAAGEEEVVAPTRDVTKPEQMTREEYSASNTATLNKVAALRDEMFKKQRQEYEAERTKLQKKRAAALKRISRLNLNGSTEEIDPNTDSASKRIIEGLQKDIKKIDETLFTLMPPIQTKVFDEAAKELGYDKKETHRGVVHDALVARKPVNAAAADAYGYAKLPEGYVKQGDLYVFQPKEFTSGGKQPLQTGSGTGTTRQLQAGKERGETKALESEGISVTAGEYITEDEARAGFQIAVGTLDKGSVAPDSPAILISEKLSKDSDAVKAIYGFPNSVRGVLIQIHLGLPVSIEGDNTQRAFKIASEAPKFFPLAKNYTRQGDLYVFQPGATGEPVQAAPSAAQAAKATAPGPIQKPVTQGQIQAKIQELLRAPTKGTKKPAVSFKTQTEENAFARGFQAATERQGEPPPARMPNRSPKDQKWDEAWYKGWASGQTFVRSLPSPTSIEQLPQTTTVATQTETAAPGPVSPILDDEIRELAKNTYLSLNGTEAGRKLTESAEGVFIGQPSAVDELFDTKRIEAGGFRIKELKQAADDLYASYSTVRDMLRRKFGSKITLYRSQGSGEEGRVIYGKKSTLNWASSPQEASQYDVGSRTLVKKEIPVEDIIVVNVGPKGNYDEFIVFNEEAKPDLPPSALREKSKFAADFQVKRGANFSSDGVYDVNTPEGIRRIFRDSETGAWMDADQKAPVYSPLPFKFLGYSKKEAIEALRKESQTTTVATNETAAPLAKEGEKNLDKIYLNVPFTSKDNAKSLGAKWDKDKKLWFIQKNDNGFMPTVPERWIPDEQSVIRDKKELSAAKVNAEAKYNRVVEVVETTVSGSKAFALKFTDGQWLNPNIEKNDQSFQPPSQKENIWTLPIEETEDKIWQQVFARESAKLDAMKKGKRNPKSPYFNIRDSEIEKQQRELERLRNNKNSIGIEWGELVRAFDESLVNGEPISANQEQLFILKRLPREEFLARLKNAGYEQSGETFYPRQSSTGGGAVGQTRINPPSPAGGATQTTAAEKQTPAPSRKGAGAAGASSSLTGGRSGELPPSETQETQPSTGEIPVAERDADSIIGALDVMRNQFRDQAKVKRTLDDEVGRLPKAKLKEVADALGVKAIKDEVVASIMSEPTRTEKVMADIYGKEEEEAEQRESFKEERKRARDSITAKDKPLDERPEVTGQDVAFAKQLVQKEVPAATFATVMTAEEFLASESLTTAFRDIAAGLRAGRIEGVFISSGHVFLFPENIIARQSDIKAAEELGIPVSVAAARRVILHESLVHFGFAGLTDSEQNWLIDWAKRHSTEADIAEVLRKYPRESNEDQATHMLRAFEERLAAIIEKTGKWPTSSAWQELKAFLRRLYNRIMGVADSKPTDKELLNVLRMLQSGSERMLEKSFAKTGLGGNVRLTNKPSYAGEKAEMPQFMRDSLDTAKAMAAAGKDGEEIRSVTGWFSGKYDGKMRWEVPDEGASLLKTETIRAGYPADQVINHRNLFDIYPDLRKVVVAFYPLPNNERGGFDSFGNGRIEIAERLSDEEKLSTLLHEIQHWIQNKEGFSKGGTPQAASRKLAEKSEASQRAKRDFDEAKARYESLKEAAKSKITKERGGLGRLDDLLADLEPNVKKAFDEMLAAKHKASFSPVLEGYKVSDDDAFQGYRSMAGEIEARDVQARQKLTPEQRRATAPYSSENIAKEDAIVMFGGGTQASYSTADEARLAELYQNLTPELPNPAVREAYDRLATTQTQVAISDLRNESALSKEDFAQSLQTLFDNGQAVLSPASSIEQQEADAAEYGVFGHGGTPASFVTVMPETNPQYESRTPIILKAGASTSVGGVGMASISPSDNSARAQAIREGISKTNWNELSTAQRAQALEEFGLKSISSRYFFDAAILPVLLTNERTGENRPASVYVAEPSPAITIQFDASGLSNLLSGDAVTAFTAVYDIAQEEVIHTAQHLNAYAKWQDSGVMLPFEKFEVDYYTSMLLEMVQSASKGLSNGDARVANIIVSAWNLYNPNSPSNDVNRIVEKLAQSNTAPAFTMEVGRQLIQFKRQDFTTETGWMRFVEAMKKYLSDALEALKTSLGLAQSGKAGELLQREIRDVESILDRLESNPNSIIPAKFSLADTSRDAEYLAAVEAGDSGNDNLIQLLKVSPQNERKAVFEAWVKRNPEAAAKAQRTVDEAAKSAGYNVGPVPHGTTAGPFNEFRVPAYFGSGASMYAQADSELVSWNGPRVRVTSIEPEQIEDNLDSATAPQDFSYEELYAGKANGRFVSFGGDGIYRFDGLNATGDYKYALVENLTPVRDNSFNIVAVEDAPPPSEFPRIIRAYLKIQNPAILNAREGSRLAKGPNGSWDQELYDGLVSAGYDGVIADDDWGGPWNKHYIVFSPNQIKSADPVTYDDAGNVIPPSQRFQPKSPDIRFSLNSAQEESENESAKEASKKIKSIGVQVAELQAKAKQAPWQGRDVPVDMVLANHPAMTNEVRGEIMALARKIIESKLAAGIPYEELATDVTKRSFIGKVTRGNEFFAEPMRQALLTEVGLVMHTEAQRLAADGKPLEADILLSNYQSVTQAAANKSSVGSNVLRMWQGIINHPDYGPLHIANNIRALQAEERRKTVGTNAPGLADEVKAVDAAKDQAAKDVADAVEDIQERSDEEFAMEVMDDEAKSIWQMMKDEIAYIGELARSLVEAGVKGFKASKAASSPVRDSIKNMTVEQRMDEIRKAQTRFKKLGKRLEEVMSKKADEPKRKRVKKVIDTALSNEGLEQTEDGELKATKPRKPRKRQDLFSATEEEQIRIIQRKLNDLRPEEGGIKIPWDKLAQIRISEQKTLESQMFEALKADPAFAGLPDSDLAKLSKIVSKVWQKKRETVIAKELERIEARNDWSKKAKTAVKEHHPKIMRLINARLFDDNALYALIAEEYGFKELTPEQQARAIAITEKFMDPKTPRYVRAALQKEFKDIMMEVRGPTLLQTLNAVWYSSVLSSMRTMITIALGVLNNGLIFIGEAVATVIANPTNPSKWIPILDSIDAIAKNLGPAAVDMWKYLKTGDSVYLDSNILNDPFYADQIKKGVALDGVDVGERMYRTAKNPVTKAIGWHVMVITRLLRVLDGFNTRLGKVSSMPFMYRRLTDEYDSSVVRALTDPAHYREKLIQDGVDPNSPALSALAMHAMHEDWDSQKGLLSNLEQNTNYNGAWSSMTSDPKGAGGVLYGSVKMIERFMGTVADTFEKAVDQRLEMMGKQGVEKDPLEDFIVRRLGKPSSYFLNYLASGLLPGLGLGFVRVVGNSLNQAISLIPGIGLLRVMENQDPRQKVAHRALLMRNQAFGIIGLMVMVKALKDIEDEPDDEKRGWGIEGNWEGLTPQQKAALFASGAQPNSFFVYRNGKRVNIRYSEWPLASIFSLTGNLSDNIKYRPESWQTASAGSKAAKAVYYMWSSAFTMPAISQAMENLGAPRGSEDPFEAAERRIPKALASFAGGYIPRSIKDLDMWMQSETNRYKGWESLAKEIPFVRRAVGTEYLDVFGKQLETDRAPWSRVFTEGPDDPAYQLLGRLSAKGVWLSPPNPNGKLVGEGSKRREMTPDEGVMYQKEVGKGYRQLVLRYGNRLLQMPEERAKKFASQKAEEVREKVTAKIDRIVR